MSDWIAGLVLAVLGIIGAAVLAVSAGTVVDLLWPDGDDQ